MDVKDVRARRKAPLSTEHGGVASANLIETWVTRLQEAENQIVIAYEVYDVRPAIRTC